MGGKINPFPPIFMFTEKDLVQIRNISVALGKASFEKLSAQEILAMSQAFSWLGGLQKKIEEDILNQNNSNIAPVASSDLPTNSASEVMGTPGLHEPAPKKGRRKS